MSRPQAKQMLGAALADRGLSASVRENSADTSGAEGMVYVIARHIAKLKDGTSDGASESDGAVGEWS